MSYVIVDQIPDNWEMCKLGDVMRLKNGYAFKSKDYTDRGVPLIRISDINDSIVSTEKAVRIPTDLVNEDFYIEEGDLLIAMSGATTGKTGVYRGKEKLLQNQRVGNFKIFDEKVVEKRYRNFYVLFLRKEIEKAAYGGAQPNISAKRIENFPFPLAPLEQQKRIVAKIEELFSHIDAGIEALNKAKQLLKQYRQSVLTAAVTGELTKEWREQNKGKLEPASQLLDRILKERRQKWEEQQLTHFKAKGKMPKSDKWKEKYRELDLVANEELKELPELPEGWIYTRLGNLIEDPKYGTSKKCTYDSKGLGVLRIPNVANGEVDAADLKFAEFGEQEIATYRLQEGDILTIRSNGSVNLVGKCALINEDDKEYLYAGYLIRLRPFKTLVSSRYLIQSLNSIYLRRQIESKAKSTSGVNNINSGELQSLIIPVCPLEEQTQAERGVGKKLDSIERLVGEIELELLRAEKNRQSIMASAFSGRLLDESCS